MDKSYTERRRHTRYTAKERVLVMIQPTPTETYHVLDISMGGLAFRYLGDSRRYNENILSGYLVCEKKGLIIENLTLEIISDRLLEDSFIPTGRCGVQFKHISQEQSEKLKEIVAKCSVDNLD